jgi:hypothetical protein
MRCKRAEGHEGHHMGDYEHTPGVGTWVKLWPGPNDDAAQESVRS